MMMPSISCTGKTGLRERMLHRDRREIGGRLVVLGVPPLLDTGELDDLRLGAAGKLFQNLAGSTSRFCRHRIAEARDADGFRVRGNRDFRFQI